MPDHIFTSSSGFRQISFTVRIFSRSLRFFARICTLLFQHSHHHDCHKQHAHAPDKDIDRPDRHVDLIVHALLDGSVFQPLILLLKPFIFFSGLFSFKVSTASLAASATVSASPIFSISSSILSPPAFSGFTQQQQVKTHFASFPLLSRQSPRSRASVDFGSLFA